MFGLKLSMLGLGLGGVLLVVLAIFLVAYRAGEKADQRRVDPVVAGICAAAGATWVETDKDGKPLARAKWGRDCKAAAAKLAAFKADALAGRAKALEQYGREQDQKTAADVAAAERQAKALSAARFSMEQEDVAVKDDRVGGSWFARLNDLGGLRAPGAGQADRPLRNPQGPAAR